MHSLRIVHPTTESAPVAVPGRISCSSAFSPDAASEYRCLETVLNSLDALVYVSDMQTQELLFVSQYGRKFWGAPEGKKCYEYLQAGQTAPCEFCTNPKLLDADGKPRGVLVWEFENTVTGRWYQCRDQAIPWVDGRLVRMEVAIDITERKHFEEQLAQAKAEAEAARMQAEELARVDALTKANNRRAFDEHMERVTGYLQRKPVPISLILLDLDHFKEINDRYGHAFGDQVLIAVCERLRSQMREFDQLFRLGGEEFVIVLLDCELSIAAKLVERLRHSIETMTLYAGGVPVPITSSFGLAALLPGMSVQTLLANADAALYAAKANGRNCCCIADGEAH